MLARGDAAGQLARPRLAKHQGAVPPRALPVEAGPRKRLPLLWADRHAPVLPAHLCPPARAAPSRHRHRRGDLRSRQRYSRPRCRRAARLMFCSWTRYCIIVDPGGKERTARPRALCPVLTPVRLSRGRELTSVMVNVWLLLPAARCRRASNHDSSNLERHVSTVSKRWLTQSHSHTHTLARQSSARHTHSINQPRRNLSVHTYVCMTHATVQSTKPRGLARQRRQWRAMMRTPQTRKAPKIEAAYMRFPRKRRIGAFDR